MAPPSPITCRPSAARHPLLLRVPTARAATLGLGLGLPRTEAVVALRAHVRRIEAEPWASALVAVSRNRREEAVRCAAAGEVTGSTGVGRSAGMEVALAAAAVVAMGTGNRVLYKLALVPLRQYPFFLAQFATFGYVVVYFSILYLRYQAGIVTDEMLSLPQKPFLVVGLLEAFAAASGMAAGDLSCLAASSICYLFEEALQNQRDNWMLSSGCRCHNNCSKEIIFIDAAKKLKGGSVDLFVVNSYGSAYQALFMCLLLPFLSKLWGVPFHLLPTYIKDGAACFLNMGSLSSGCEGAPLLPLLFVLVNMGFNISLLHLLKISSAVVSSLASTFSVPLSIYAFTLPLPYIGVASSLPPGFVAGAAVLTAGLLVYSLPQGQHSGNSFRNRND
ncbi:protein CLT1, chloroplastic-like isoform X3 [Phragmites australis]|uniref:protein CLT1, chloroplastic-like isoform X3 n=1 Tax=Phragmites australis TaxID=29695 RepID=UPI002D78756B|nr:protein CLT1, chloroplastic-like isoform X3 [Phragmites australis]